MHLTLRNPSDLPVRLPAVELTLTDMRGWLDKAHALTAEEAAEKCEADGEPAGRLTPAL